MPLSALDRHLITAYTHISTAVAALESGGQLLAPIEQDLLLLWTGMVFLTLRELDIPLHETVSEQERWCIISKFTQQVSILVSGYVW